LGLLSGYSVIPVSMSISNCSGWLLEGAWHLQNSAENAKLACHKIVWNDQIQEKCQAPEQLRLLYKILDETAIRETLILGFEKPEI
jgi:hypothetical protein